MIPTHKFHITFEEMAVRGAQILANQPPVTYEQALQQINLIMANRKPRLDYSPNWLIPHYLKACGDNEQKLLKILDDNRGIIGIGRGSLTKHQAWMGGYLQHVADTISIAYRIMNNTPPNWPIQFSRGSVVLVLFIHDIEKPFMQHEMGANPEMQPWNELQREQFRNKIISDYNIAITDEERHALKYIHGEGAAYHPTERVMNELGALCHAADVLSSRLWFNRNKP